MAKKKEYKSKYREKVNDRRHGLINEQSPYYPIEMATSKMAFDAKGLKVSAQGVFTQRNKSNG